jgi:hypothetical protein
LGNFLKNKPHRNRALFSKPIIVHKKIIVLILHVSYLLEERIPPGWQYEQACSYGKALFNHAIYGVCEGFCQVALDFIWVV